MHRVSLLRALERDVRIWDYEDVIKLLVINGVPLNRQDWTNDVPSVTITPIGWLEIQMDKHSGSESYIILQSLYSYLKSRGAK